MESEIERKFLVETAEDERERLLMLLLVGSCYNALSCSSFACDIHWLVLCMAVRLIKWKAVGGLLRH